METTRRGRRSNGRRLTAVDGWGQPDDELVELRAQLTAAGAPEAVLHALDQASDAEEALRNLVQAGMLPSPEQCLAGLLEGWTPLLKPGADALSAELSPALGTALPSSPGDRHLSGCGS